MGSGLPRLWEGGASWLGPTDGRVDAELGYGFRVPRRRRRGDGLALSLEAERHEAQTPNNGAKLDFNMRW